MPALKYNLPPPYQINTPTAKLISFNDVALSNTDPELPCTEPMGMQSYFITDAQIESSSNYGAWLAQNSRLLSTINAWRPSNDKTDQWISVNLYRQTQVAAVVLQGAYGRNWWVETYQVAYSLDNDFDNFEFVKDESGKPEASNGINFN